MEDINVVVEVGNHQIPLIDIPPLQIQEFLTAFPNYLKHLASD